MTSINTPRTKPPTRTVRRRWVAAAWAPLLALGLVAGPALADPSAPSDADIAAARQAEALAAASVAEVEALLDDLRTASEASAQTAGLAAEAYNQATVDRDSAETEATAALTAVDDAGRDLEAARGALARVAISADQASSELAIFEPFLKADALDEALDRAELIHLAGTTSGRASERFAVAEQAARAASARADQAVAIHAERTEAAERAAVKAERAAKAAAQAQAEAQERHAVLLAVLAEKRGTTADLEAQAEQARVAAENERARREAEAAQKASAESEETVTDEETPGPSSSASEEPSPSASGETEDQTTPTAEPTPEPSATPAPAPEGETSSASAGEGAVAWARAQIGKPYKWGGSGPDGFDCSGLTSAAWRNGGGKAIPRVASSQYAAAVKVPFDQMRPGDLIFWGSAANAIYHVAIYSGGGMMIEAPRAGETVTEIPVRWSGVFGYAGRF